MLIYYASKVLNGAKGRYTPIEKMALALVVTARRLHPYFLSHPIGLKTNMPLKQTLGKPDTSERLVKWALELSEYDISYLPRTTIKAQALTDFISEMARLSLGDAPKDKKWLLHVDGSSTIQGGRHMRSKGRKHDTISPTNSRMKTNFESFQIVQIPREENIKVDCLSKLASALMDCRTRHVTIQYLPKPKTLLTIQAISSTEIGEHL
ncbi:UNVERIFIED_CONTAM: hypothetical protein Slati_0454700 [Sesamum latifolium]|uniref:Reverse transcriptase RNase H-like domain-containing protein n=1 Tax=Sesamum latifolium TaxID=2727402 RepID=A0AAW2XWB1_9LAMI